MDLRNLKINFLGDSITQGVGASSEQTVYHAVLKKEPGDFGTLKEYVSIIREVLRAALMQNLLRRF